MVSRWLLILILATGIGGGYSQAVARDNASLAMNGHANAAAQAAIARQIEARIRVLQAEPAYSREARYLNNVVVEFYTQRHFQPIWQQAALDELLLALVSLHQDGLNPEDYDLSTLLQWSADEPDSGSAADIARAADRDLLATHSFLRALYHLYKGKVDPVSLDPQWNFALQDIAPDAVSILLGTRVDAGQIAAMFADARPQHPQYVNLQAALRRYRAFAAQGGWPGVPDGPTLKPCMVDVQVIALRKRLSITGEYPATAPDLTAAYAENSPPDLPLLQQAAPANAPPAESSTAATGCTPVAAPSAPPAEPLPGLAALADQQSSFTVAGEGDANSQRSSAGSAVLNVNPEEIYDEQLVAAVKAFQRNQLLDDDGVVGPATRAALNVSVEERIDQIRVNLERARWLLHSPPDELLLVDVAGFKVTYFKNNQPIWRSRVQVGSAYRSTPIFKSAVSYITFNPTWTVPPTILKKDVLPKVRKDPNYLQENNMHVLDFNGNELDPKTIDWNNPGGIMLRQNAGPHSALGKAVIRFPNPYSVYLHDTPHQRLFEKTQRAFSSGCIRVEHALELVDLLLGETPKWTPEAIDQALATGKTRNVQLAKRVPILLAYWTVDAASPDDAVFKPDIYKRDAKVLAALNRSN